MQNLNITLIQSDITWEKADANLEHFATTLNSLKEATDLVLLPEMFSTGFSMNTKKLAETMQGKSLTWMLEQSRRLNCVLCGSLIIEEKGNYFNRLLWVKPDGTWEHYDKRHLFRMAEEDQYFSSGSKRLITDIKGWKICPLVCYDLRFPVWSRNTFTKTGPKTCSPLYDVLLYVANWPDRRSLAWKSLLPARAIENQSYTIGLNRIGNDGKDITYSGDSAAYSFKGELMASVPSNLEGSVTVSLDYASLKEFREYFPAGLDADQFELT
jgi:omega-amidase